MIFSDNYVETDIQQAMSSIESSLNDYLQSGKLYSLTFDEVKSEELISNYLPTLDFYQEIKECETMFISSKIRTGMFTSSLNSLTTYENFYWIVVKKEQWEVFYGGFLT